MQSEIGVIDLFAGPGGLGEGFSAFRASNGLQPFRIKASVECEPSAHRTLQLRAFFRQFNDRVPDIYYQYVRGEVDRDALLSAWPVEAAAMLDETLHTPRTLGDESDDRVVFKKIRELRRSIDTPWVVIGGPPCQAYSLVGRARNKGNKDYRPERDKRHFLYEEYLRVLDIVRPEVFVMENVKGLLSSRINGGRIFERLLSDLHDPSRAVGKSRSRTRYRIYSLVPDQRNGGLFDLQNTDFLLRSEQFGVPQARHRVILVGVSESLSTAPRPLKLASQTAKVEGVLRALPPIRSGVSRGDDSLEHWRAIIEAGFKRAYKASGVTKSELDRLVTRCRRLKSRGQRFHSYRANMKVSTELDRWLVDEKLGGFVSHESRAHIESDLHRYLFCSLYALANNGASPRTPDFPESLVPNHKNWTSGKFADRFKVQWKGRQSSTVTSHISKDGHYFIHYDPAQARSLTVREAARLQTFPDNYHFEGNRTQQYVQVGNAVPPYLAHQIAESIYEVIAAS